MLYAANRVSTISSTSIAFSYLTDAVAQSKHTVPSHSKFVIADAPSPFASPTLRATGETTGSALAAEVIIVDASAAVGKSTLAKHLSATRAAPLLDLSKVPVSTGTLTALLADLVGADPLGAFHAGEITIVVDALDEGRLLSTDTGFDSFILTIGELLARDRTVTTRPKLVLLGRPESTAIARTGLLLGCGSVVTSSLEVDYFAELEARNLIDAYAASSAEKNAVYHEHREPAKRVVQAYFDAIEGALNLEKGMLWQDARGRAFAGYAPVLAALGFLLAKTEKFIEVENQLRQTGARRAWGVLETVLHGILTREREKLCKQLAGHVASAVPSEAYDAVEQLTHLSAYVHGRKLARSPRVGFTGADLAQYESMVNRQVGEHPFIKDREFANPVVASLVLANAVERDLLRDADRGRLGQASRQPFLWRSMSARLGEQTLLDGRYLGFLLNSLWNDPVVPGSEVSVWTRSDDSTLVHVRERGSQTPIVFSIALPAMLYARARDCDVDVEGRLLLEGMAWPPGGRRVFEISGNTSLVADELVVESDRLSLAGDVWIEAESASSDPSSSTTLDIHAVAGLSIGWGESIRGRFPWNQCPATRTKRPEGDHRDVLTRLLGECALRLAGKVLTLSPQYTVAEDNRMRWAARDFPEAFPRLIRLMHEHGLAHDRSTETGGAMKVLVSFTCPWSDLEDALLHPDAHPELAAFMAAARNVIH